MINLSLCFCVMIGKRGEGSVKKEKKKGEKKARREMRKRDTGETYLWRRMCGRLQC